MPTDLTRLTPALGPDDAGDPRRFHDRRRAGRGPGRKAAQLCEQVRHALSLAVADLADPVLQNLRVLGVSPAPHSGRLLVTVASADPDAEVRLRAAAGRLRTAVAGCVHRRKAPELVFAVA